MTALPARAIQELSQKVRGEIVKPGDASYDTARAVWNGYVDGRPALLVRPSDAQDVSTAIGFARENGLLIAIRGGGHNSAGTGVCNEGLVIDLGSLRGVSVDSATRSVRAQGGALLSDVDVATSAHGLAVPAGIVSHTGVGGLTLGGGFGWISRRHGLSVDNLLSAEVVTADGQIVSASDREHPDLFWGLRGGGGNFGVVTEFTFRAAPIGTHVYSGLIVKRFEDAHRYIAFHRDFVRGLPDEATVWMVVRKAPPLPFLPADVHRQLVVVVPFVYLGEQADGERLLAPLRSVTPSVGEAIGMNPWAGWQAGFDPLVSHGARNYWKSHHFVDLPEACIECILEYAETMPSDECEVFVPHMEGAPSRVPEEATAFAHRRQPFGFNIHTRWRNSDDDERCLAWVRAFHTATRPFARGVYVNFISGGEGEARVQDAYTPPVWRRLVEVKTTWDPENVFRVNQNIRPHGRAAGA
jgi:FAD/FMN-containing dehydrogenase